MSTAEDRMRRYQLVATAAYLKGFRHLAPAGGVDDARAAYFFKVSWVDADRLVALALVSFLVVPGRLALSRVHEFDSCRRVLQLRRSRCADITVKDVCLHPPGPERIGSSCSYRVRASSSSRFVRENCFPTCANPAHLVRKCKGCGLLGSVELIPGGGKPISTGTSVLMILECIGYTPLSFWPGAEWTLTTMAGAKIAVEFTGDSFMGTDDVAGTTTVIKGVRFFIKDVQFQ
ncbi:unnamed protein product [Urochloa humidicola]